MKYTLTFQRPDGQTREFSVTGKHVKAASKALGRSGSYFGQIFKEMCDDIQQYERGETPGQDVGEGTETGG